ncbi:MAG: hypothetical protein ACRDPI_09460 [Nocardioidaceae bacterium]
MALGGTALGSRGAAPARLLASCRSYGPGHQIHWLQKEHAIACEGDVVSALRINGSDLELELSDGRTLWWRHHDPSGVADALEANPDELLAHVALTTLQLGDRWFSCADAAWPWEDCSRR